MHGLCLFRNCKVAVLLCVLRHKKIMHKKKKKVLGSFLWLHYHNALLCQFTEFLGILYMCTVTRNHEEPSVLPSYLFFCIQTI